MEFFIRECPKCVNEIKYKSQLTYNNAIKYNSVCRKCASSGENNGMFGRNAERNPFFGKQHSVETLQKLRTADRSYTQTESFRKIHSENNQGVKNNMYGKSVYSVWITKFGVDEANKKMLQYKQKQSENNQGVKNNMYGKPAPNGAGNGWSGWYKGWFFRSLKELTYMIKVIERFNLIWSTAETNEFKIQYVDFNGDIKNYFPDFVIENKYLIECKPKRLWNSDVVLRKKNAAIDYCLTKKLKYKLVDVGKLSNFELKELYDNKLIEFTKKYQKLYEIKYGTN